tara:strand:+ start:271 stop:579 length:309 start_codon:yes stop_codon:yes gene_type:complete
MVGILHLNMDMLHHMDSGDSLGKRIQQQINFLDMDKVVVVDCMVDMNHRHIVEDMVYMVGMDILEVDLIWLEVGLKLVVIDLTHTKHIHLDHIKLLFLLYHI